MHDVEVHSDNLPFNDSGPLAPFYMQALDLSPQDIFVVSEDGSALYVNLTACKRRNVSRDYLLNQKVWEWNRFIKPSSWSRRWNSILDIREAEFETIHLHPLGGEIAVKVWARLIDFAGKPAVLCYIQEIGELKHSALKEELLAEDIALLMRANDASICHLDPSAQRVNLDISFNKMFGIADEVTSISFEQWESMVDLHDQLEWRSQLNDHLLGKNSKFDVVIRMRHADGHFLYIRAQGKAIKLDDKGHYIKVPVVHQDISLRLQQQRQFNEEVEQLSQRNRVLENNNFELMLGIKALNDKFKQSEIIHEIKDVIGEHEMGLGYLRINLTDGSIEADDAWIALNEFAPGTPIDRDSLQSTISPGDLERFKVYSFGLIKGPVMDEWSNIELNLITFKGHGFSGHIRSRKQHDARGEFIESFVNPDKGQPY